MKLEITPKQKVVVRLIALGYTTNEVAAELGVMPRTAKAYADALRSKLRCENRRDIPLAYWRLTGDNPYPSSMRDVADVAG